MWGGVADVINCAKFFENRSKGFGAVRPRKIAFPIEIVHRPYNSVGTTVPHCEEVMSAKELIERVLPDRLPKRKGVDKRKSTIEDLG